MMTVLVGADVSEEEEKEATDRLNAKYGDTLEILVRRGDQPVYSFLIGVEE